MKTNKLSVHEMKVQCVWEPKRFLSNPEYLLLQDDNEQNNWVFLPKFDIYHSENIIFSLPEWGWYETQYELLPSYKRRDESF